MSGELSTDRYDAQVPFNSSATLSYRYIVHVISLLAGTIHQARTLATHRLAKESPR